MPWTRRSDYFHAGCTGASSVSVYVRIHEHMWRIAVASAQQMEALCSSLLSEPCNKMKPSCSSFCKATCEQCDGCLYVAHASTPDKF